MYEVILITVLTFALNLPFGYFRSRSRKYSLKWFLYIHVPVPLVIIARLVSQTDYKFIPIFVIAAVVGQLCGGRIGAT